MDPAAYEQKLRDEVIYLHSLWHQGPPSSSRHLKPTQSTNFKKPKTIQHSKQWPCPPSPPAHPTDWPKPTSSIPLSLDEKSKPPSSKHAQQNAITAAHKFFLENSHDPDMVDSSGSEDEVDLIMDEESDLEFEFFYKLFTEDAVLREHYVKNYIQGEFCCLVCGAVGGRGAGKRFKSCLALVQHSVTISKTKRMRAHRAFGQAVCKVLGWDIDQLHSMVSLLSECKPGEEQVSVDMANKESSTSGVVGTSDVIVSLHSEKILEDAQENVNVDLKEDSVTSTGNVDVVEGANHGVVQESGGVYVLSEHTSDNDGVVISERGGAVSMLLEHTSEDNEIMPESGDAYFKLNEHTSDNNDINDRSLESGPNVSVLHALTSEDNGLVLENGVILCLLNEKASDNISGIMPEIGAVVSMLNGSTADTSGGVVKGDGDEQTSGETHAASSDKEMPVTSFCNLDSVEGDGGVVVPESGAIDTGYQENVNSLTNPDVVITLPNHPEEPEAEGLIIVADTDEKYGAGNEMQVDVDFGLSSLKEIAKI